MKILAAILATRVYMFLLIYNETLYPRITSFMVNVSGRLVPIEDEVISEFEVA